MMPIPYIPCFDHGIYCKNICIYIYIYTYIYTVYIIIMYITDIYIFIDTYRLQDIPYGSKRLRVGTANPPVIIADVEMSQMSPGVDGGLQEIEMFPLVWIPWGASGFFPFFPWDFSNGVEDFTMERQRIFHNRCFSDLKHDLPSGYVKIAIENDHRNSGFSH